MALSRKEFRQFIRDFNFRELFNEMGWDNDRTVQSVTIDHESFALESVAQKTGFRILVCSPDSEGRIPSSALRKKLETRVTRLFPEHLVIFRNDAGTEQIWQWVSRSTGRPSRRTETRWNSHQDPELLFQRASGIFFELDEEENITIVDVTSRIAANFDQNNERVTKRFYEVFKKQHGTFYDFVSGIDDHIDQWNEAHPKQKKDNLNKQWYVSLMLNRLMFCYFIQKKGFLDKNKNYLRDKLTESREKHGDNKYYSFYRDFLLALFHKGLGAPGHVDTLRAEIGEIPYLNGGLFDTHELEEQLIGDIEIKDEAFEKIFNFFDGYEWHLDTTENATGRDVNPDVIGYIFEKYINERSAMGAYYTKEDITDYISKNCVLPFLFNETERHYPSAFRSDSEIWTSLKNSGDEYIYNALKKGVGISLPKNIEIGNDTAKSNLLERRKDWNQPALEEYALPTEIWREAVDRRRRYAEAKTAVETHKISKINDFITYNLNIRQFVLDSVQNTNDPKFLEHFYKSLAGHTPGEGTNEKARNPISILDPTCGSGAFLFAAMNILEELYTACLQRMEDFVEDEDRSNEADRSTFRNQYVYFRRVLAYVKNEKDHPSQQYFVYKSIILNNLYGVDIMKEAVEIAKLRLFLKLVATVDANYSKPNLGLEPLPDIDFNIRAGNTLVGFADEASLDDALRSTIQGQIAKSAITEKMEIVAMAFQRFKNSQVTTSNHNTVKEDKSILLGRLSELNDELHRLSLPDATSDAFNQWRDSHKPFHWLAEFYEIVHDQGGFDVLVGNPPYVEYSKVRAVYQLSAEYYKTLSSGNLYAFVVERSLRILARDGRMGFIVPISLTCTQRMAPLQNVLLTNSADIWNSSYAERPSKLFTGAEVLLTICLLGKRNDGEARVFSSGLRKWRTRERDTLFDTTSYIYSVPRLRKYILPKMSSTTETSVLRKCWNDHNVLGGDMLTSGDDFLFYRIGGGRYWKVFTTFQPLFVLNGEQTVSSRESYLYFDSPESRDVAVTILSSTFFYWYFVLTTNGRDLNPSDLKLFPLSIRTLDKQTKSSLTKLCQELMRDYKLNKREMEKTSSLTGRIVYEEFYPRLSKPTIDEIDKVLAKHFGLTEEELDYVINYDIKYRMGRELDGDDE